MSDNISVKAWKHNLQKNSFRGQRRAHQKCSNNLTLKWKRNLQKNNFQGQNEWLQELTKDMWLQELTKEPFWEFNQDIKYVAPRAHETQ